MAVETGTATDYLDLAAKLKTFLTTNADLVAAGREWTCLRDDGIDMIFQGVGLSGTEEIFVGFEYYADAGSDLYSWSLAGLTGYVAGNNFDNQPGRETAKDDYLPLWTQPIPYWFIANGQRFIVIANVSSTYQSMYLGKFLPYATPGQYPYPLFCGGMTSKYNYRYSTVAAAMRFFPYSYSNQSSVFKPDGSIIRGAGSSVSPGATTFNIFPFNGITETSGFGELAPFDSGDVTLIQSVIMGGSLTDNPAVYGELDGIFYVGGIEMSSESIVTIDAEDYLVFQDGSLVSQCNFAAVRLV